MQYFPDEEDLSEGEEEDEELEERKVGSAGTKPLIGIQEENKLQKSKTMDK